MMIQYIYTKKKESPNEKFDKYDNASDLFDEIKNGEITLFEGKNDQAIFKSHLSEIKKETPKKKKIKGAKKCSIQY